MDNYRVDYTYFYILFNFKLVEVFSIIFAHWESVYNFKLALKGMNMILITTKQLN